MTLFYVVSEYCFRCVDDVITGWRKSDVWTEGEIRFAV